MAETADTDFDEQDSAEAFDETMTDGDAADSDAMDQKWGRSRDETAALGDEDVEGDEDALDADEESDELLDGLEDSDEDDLDDDGRDVDALDADNIPDATTNRDYADADDVDGVSAHESEEPDVISMGDPSDLDALGGQTSVSVADLESENLSDADLRELDYKE